MKEASDGRLVVGLDLHRRRSVLVRMTAGGQRLETAWIANSAAKLAWAHARQVLASRGSDPVTEAEIAAAAADLLDRAGDGPARQAPEQQHHAAAGRTSSPRSRRVAGRTAATAAPQWPRPAGPADGDQDPAGPAGDRDGQPPEAEAEATPAPVIPLPLFDARKEAEKWW
jgi:putative transposase